MRLLALLSVLLLVGLTGCDANDPAARAASSNEYFVDGPTASGVLCELTYTWNSTYGDGDDDFFGWRLLNNTAGAAIVSQGVTGGSRPGSQQTPFVVVEANGAGSFDVSALNDSGGEPLGVTINGMIACG